MSYVFKRVIEDANDLMKEYICDTRADISTLPTGNTVGKNGDICAAGSECLCLADSSVWILGKDTNKWVELGV